jgi:hypothetical protein
MSARVKNSGAPCGPSVTASSQAGLIAGRTSTGTGAGRPPVACGGPARSTSPTTNWRPPWPPKRPRVKVEALQRYEGTSNPPSTST